MAEKRPNKRSPQPGKLTEAERGQLRMLFQLIDSNEDGYIEVSDLSNLMQQLNMKANKEEIAAMMAAQNKDAKEGRKDRMDFEGFCAMMQRNEGLMTGLRSRDADVLQLFQAMDKNSDGKISMDELRETMTSVGKGFNEDDIRTMFKTADLNKDGFISYEEFNSVAKTFQDHQEQQQQQQQLPKTAQPKKDQQGKTSPPPPPPAPSKGKK